MRVLGPKSGFAGAAAEGVANAVSRIKVNANCMSAVEWNGRMKPLCMDGLGDIDCDMGLPS